MTKIFEVYYMNNDDGKETIAQFTTQKKADDFIEACKKPFYKSDSIIRYDYRGLDLCCDEWDLDEFDNIVPESK